MRLHSGKRNKAGKNRFLIFRRLKSNCPTQRHECLWKMKIRAVILFSALRTSLWSVDNVAVKIYTLTSHIVLGKKKKKQRSFVKACAMGIRFSAMNWNHTSIHITVLYPCIRTNHSMFVFARQEKVKTTHTRTKITWLDWWRWTSLEPHWSRGACALETRRAIDI